MKTIAESHLKQNFENAIISVPSSYGMIERNLVYEAGKLAGLNIKRIMNETSAAILTYYTNNYDIFKKMTNGENILIFDFGGGKLDVGIYNVNDIVIETKIIISESIGGINFDNKLARYCIKKFCKINDLEDSKIHEIYENPRILRRLLLECEIAKINLSSTIKTSIIVESLYDNIDFNIIVTREEFENICSDEFHMGRE